jgi:hypothetical protein
MNDKRQKNQLVLAFMEESRSEAPIASVEGTESLTAKRGTESPAIGEQLMEEVCERENCKQALARVKANRGSAGVNGMTVHQLPDVLVITSSKSAESHRKHVSLIANEDRGIDQADCE